MTCAAGDRFYSGAIAIAGEKVHLWIDAGRVIAQGLLHDAVAGDKVAPVVNREKSQAADAVFYRDLVGCLRLAFGEHQLFDREPLPGETVLQPRAGEREGRRVARKCAGELGQKRAREGRGCAGHVGQHDHKICGPCLGGVEEPVGPVSGDIAMAASAGHPQRYAAEVFDQRQP